MIRKLDNVGVIRKVINSGENSIKSCGLGIFAFLLGALTAAVLASSALAKDDVSIQALKWSAIGPINKNIGRRNEKSNLAVPKRPND
jgi:hypothetical protein